MNVEFHVADEYIISSKTKFIKIQQYNAKKPRKLGYKNLLRSGTGWFIYDF